MVKNKRNDKKTIIILHPDAEALLTEIKKLRAELSALVLQKDQLLHHEIRNILTRYQLTFGSLHFQSYELECDILRLRRKLSLFQTAINRQERINIHEIEMLLDKEFAFYRQKLTTMIQQMNDALERSRMPLLSDQDTAELKKLYHTIVKAIHPDLHPDLSAEWRELFHHATDAYELGDLAAMQTIKSLLSGSSLLEKQPETLPFLHKENDRLERLIHLTKEQIEELMTTFPYTMKDLLNDPVQIAEQKNAIEESISQLRKLKNEYIHQIEVIMR